MSAPARRDHVPDPGLAAYRAFCDTYTNAEMAWMMAWVALCEPATTALAATALADYRDAYPAAGRQLRAAR